MTINKKTTECEHEFVVVTNLYGKMIKDYIRRGIVHRSLTVCKKCGKRGMSTEIDKDCKVKNRPELW